MSIQISNPNNVKIYQVSGTNTSRAIPDWLARRKRRALKNDLEWRHRIELIQDFEFPEASIKIKPTRDGKYAVATGVYKPQMRVFEYAEMSMKFERHTDAENVNFVLLSDDWTKSALLQNDRSVELHAQGGIHYSTRIPKFGRDLDYHFPSCDLLVGGASNEVYRLNLDQGRFLNPLVTDSTGVNVVEINPAHQLFGFGTEDGTVEFWDPRSRSKIGMLAPTLPADMFVEDSSKLEITSMKYRSDGLSVAVGTSTGHVLLYDLRNNRPWMVKDHQYGFPIKSLHWLEGGNSESEEGKVLSADSKIIKIWNRDSGKHFTSIEPTQDINDVCVVPDSGLLFVANEGIQIHSYYIPTLGPAPRWSSFLDNLTEELEENPSQNVYENYKFVTRKELHTLGLDHLVGTSVLRAYMHGFFMDLRLYEKARLIANPFAYEEYRARAVQDKVDKERESRIRAKKNLPKVNKALASRLLKEDDKKKKKHGEHAAEQLNPLKDTRFTDLFNNPEYEVDEESTEFQLLRPVRSQDPSKNFVEVEDDDDEEESEPEGKGSDESTSESDSDNDDLRTQIRKSSKPKSKPATQRRAAGSGSIRAGVADRKHPPKFYEMKAGGQRQTSQKSFGDRVNKELSGKGFNRVSRTAMGGMEMSFKVPTNKKSRY
ncbi:Small ribosomal subunit biogenesis [Basidiobolus ranarum]|uniref:Small ribosomal subunit biogenesis n=1 Tax=Basidiobolus ranarum TaxID=34480 RepID=A0ABR2WSY7_9FUNG